MMFAIVLACVYMLPALVAADSFYLGGCDGNFDNKLDPKFFNQEGMNDLTAFATAGLAKLILWDPSAAEKDFTSMNITLTGLTAFSLDYYNDKTEESVSITGKVTFKTTPKGVLELDRESATKTYSQVFSFNDKGVADLYPLFISKTDLILRGCNGVFLGRRESLYVFTNQNYESMDMDCLKQNIKTKTGLTVNAAN